MKKITVIVVGDFLLVCQGIKTYLERYKDLEVLVDTSVTELPAFETPVSPDVVVCIAADSPNELDVIKNIRMKYGDAKIIMLVQEDSNTIINFLEAGVNACLSKFDGLDELYYAIKEVYKKDFYINMLVNRAMLGNLGPKKMMSLRELDYFTNNKVVMTSPGNGFELLILLIEMMGCDSDLYRIVSLFLVGD